LSHTSIRNGLYYSRRVLICQEIFEKYFQKIILEIYVWIQPLHIVSLRSTKRSILVYYSSHIKRFLKYKRMLIFVSYQNGRCLLRSVFSWQRSISMIYYN